jgi:hypothetical protein
MQENFKDPLAILLAQIVMIILTARLWFGYLKNRAPTVIGDYCRYRAGSFFGGNVFSRIFCRTFPVESLAKFRQIGLILLCL